MLKELWRQTSFKQYRAIRIKRYSQIRQQSHRLSQLSQTLILFKTLQWYMKRFRLALKTTMLLTWRQLVLTKCRWIREMCAICMGRASTSWATSPPSWLSRPDKTNSTSLSRSTSRTWIQSKNSSEWHIYRGLNYQLRWIRSKSMTTSSRTWIWRGKKPIRLLTMKV